MIELKENDLLFAKVNPNAIIPSKDVENAGYDIYACFEEDYIVIPPHTTKLIPTGIASCVSDKYYLQVHERGSTGSRGMKYSAGVIDSSYRGEIFIAISNVNDISIIISKFSKEELVKIHKNSFVKDYNNDRMVFSKELIFSSEDLISSDIMPRYYTIEAIVYPYEKAIAQLVVHEVPKMKVREVSYEELKSIPSKRGDGALGSSGK